MVAAKVMGFQLIDNFDSPYFLEHVLSSGVDGMYRCLVGLETIFIFHFLGSRKGKIRKYLNILIVFLNSGLWHGAIWAFIIWGVLNGIYQIIGDMTSTFRHKISLFWGIDTECFSHRLFQVIRNFVLVDFSWIFLSWKCRTSKKCFK